MHMSSVRLGFRSLVAVGLFGSSAVCLADTATLTAGSSFSGGTWSPARPAAGGAADLSVVVSAPSPWTIANDLGSGGWFSLVGLSLTTGGRLSGDGFDFASGGTMNVAAPVTNAAPLRLNGGATLTTSAYFLQNGAVSGTGDFSIDSTSTLEFTSPLQMNGSLRIVKGSVWLGTGATLDCPVVYNNTEGAGANKQLIIRGTSAGRVVTNAFVLGTENTANWNYRLLAYGGKVKLTGPLSVSSSKIATGTSGTLMVSGGATGNKFVCQASTGTSIIIDTTPINITSEFWTGDSGKVYLNVAGSSFPAYYGFSTTTLVCGGDYFFPTGANFASQNVDWANATLDLNGYNQILGGFSGQGAGTKPFTIANSNRTKVPTVTIRQASDNIMNYLKFSGDLNVVKEGTARLNLAVRVPGNLTIKAGTIYVGAAVGGYFAHTITVEAGGTLNLGGQSIACKQLVIKNGGRVTNGTITSDQTTLEPGAVVEAAIGGDVQKTGAGSLDMYPGGTFAGTSAHLRYTVPADAAVYYPFDGSLAQAMVDEAGTSDLVVESGTPQFVAAGRTGGCLYFDGATVLKTASFPRNVPTGQDPVTIAAWIKMDSGNANDAGWISFGNKANGQGSSFCIKAGYSQVQWYANNVDLWSGTRPSFNDGQWHYIVGTKDATTRRIYCDGVEVASANDAASINVGTDYFLIGKTMWASCFKGWVDDVLIVKRALSAAEIAQLYADGGVPHVTVPAGKRFTVTAGEVGLVRPRGAPAPAVSYSFDSSATWLNDSSGNNETLMVGGVSSEFSTDSPFVYGGSMSQPANGQDNHLRPVGGFPAKIPTGGASHSLCVYVKATVNKGGRGIVGWGTGSTCNMNSWAVSWSGWTYAQNTWYSGDVAVQLPGGNLGDGWHSLVETYDQSSNTRKLYLDGVLKTTSTAYTPNFTAANFYVGRSPCDGSFIGNIDEVAVYDTALTAEEVASYHAKGVGKGSLPNDVEVTVASGATLDLGYIEQTLAGLAGGGMVKGDVVLAEGAVLDMPATTDAPTIVDGKLTIAGGGSLRFSDELKATILATRDTFDFALVTAETLVGAANLANWTVQNAPGKRVVNIYVRNGNEIRVSVMRRGLMFIVR